MSKKSSTFALAFEKKHGPLAQLNRVPHYGCGGCRFESCTDHTEKTAEWRSFLLLVVWGFGFWSPIGLSDSGNQKSGDKPIIFRVGGHREKASCVLSRRSPVRSQVRIWLG